MSLSANPFTDIEQNIHDMPADHSPRIMIHGPLWGIIYISRTNKLSVWHT